MCLKPAGTATFDLLSHSLYLVAVITFVFGISLPLFLRTQVVGLIKSLCFSLLVILLTGLINRIGIKLKILEIGGKFTLPRLYKVTNQH